MPAVHPVVGAVHDKSALPGTVCSCASMADSARLARKDSTAPAKTRLIVRSVIIVSSIVPSYETVQGACLLLDHVPLSAQLIAVGALPPSAQ